MDVPCGEVLQRGKNIRKVVSKRNCHLQNKGNNIRRESCKQKMLSGRYFLVLVKVQFDHLENWEVSSNKVSIGISFPAEPEVEGNKYFHFLILN